MSDVATGSGEGQDPDVVAALWQKTDEFRSKRAALAEVENEVMDLLVKLERVDTPIIEMLKICNEPLLVSQALRVGRFADDKGDKKRSLTEIYTRVIRIATEINNEPRR